MTKFEAGMLEFARAAKRIMERSPEGVSAVDQRGLNAGLAAMEAAGSTARKVETKA